MKTKSFRAFLILVGLMFVGGGTMQAGVVDKFKNFVESEFTNIQALYIMGGVVVSGLVFYILVNHFGKEGEKRARTTTNYSNNRRHSHHNRVIKKTA